MASIAEIKKYPIPQHVAVIMDGNGRWAKLRNQDRLIGHQQGATALRNTLEGALELGIKYLTVYAFSIENWNRTESEVSGLMNLFVTTCKLELPTLQKHNIRFRAIGNLAMLNKDCQNSIRVMEEQTMQNTSLTLLVAISYSSRWEIANAAKQIAQGVQAGDISIDDIDEQMVAKHLLTHDIPDPDLLIRTSGEYRISNYLLWQIAYTELYFTDCFWPDFNKEQLFEAVADYQKRERRFGKTSEQL
ncbi:MAG: isoprenyl transferase [Bacteroidales bacterium]|nr:isoprenyl transferase [Bacteroidales bacterium]